MSGLGGWQSQMAAALAGSAAGSQGQARHRAPGGAQTADGGDGNPGRQRTQARDSGRWGGTVSLCQSAAELLRLS